MAYVLWQRHLCAQSPQSALAGPRPVRPVGRPRLTLLYSLLHLTGYDLGLDDLKAFRQWGSRTPGHPEVHLTPESRRRRARWARARPTRSAWRWRSASWPHRFNRPGHEIVIAPDVLPGRRRRSHGGDLRGGRLARRAPEARQARLPLRRQPRLARRSRPRRASPRTSARGTRPTAGRSCASRTATPTSTASTRAIRTAVSQEERPTIIAVRTTIGYGSPHKAGTTAAHGSPLGVEEVALTKKALGWEWTDAFHIPKEALEHLRSAVARGDKSRGRVAAALRGVREGVPGSRRGVARRREGRAAERLGRRPSEVEGGRIPRHPRGVRQGHQRDRQARARASRRRRRPRRVDEDAHRRRGRVRRPDGRREQHPLRRARARDGGDRQRHGLPRRACGPSSPPSSASRTTCARRSASRPCRTCRRSSSGRTTRSGSARTGPTHQAVEQLMSLRAMPHFSIVRPGDANETAEAWRAAIEHREGAVGLVLCRQNVPVLDRSGAKGDVSRGAYVLAEASGGKPRLILIGDGLRAPARRRGAPEARGRGNPDPGRFDALLGVLRGAAEGVSRRGAPAGRPGEALDRGRGDAGLGDGTSATAAGRSASTATGPRRREKS